MGSLDEYFDGSNDFKIEELLHGDSMVYTDGKVHGSDESIKLVSTDGKVIGTILGNIDIIKPGLTLKQRWAL